MKKGEKYPKSIIERFETFEKDCNIEEMSISAFKGSGYGGDDEVCIIGEIIGDKLPYDILMLITIHNEEGEVIGTDFRERIDVDSFSGIYSFSRDVSVAGGEKISKNRVYPVNNQVGWV